MKKKIIRALKFTIKWSYKICVAAAGVTAFTNPVSASITGAVAISSAISSGLKDKNIKPAMKLINIIACNIDKAKNDPKENA